MRLKAPAFDSLIKAALGEDLKEAGDITTQSIFSAGVSAKGVFICRDEGVLAGLPVAQRVFELLDRAVVFTPLVADASRVKSAQKLATVEGSAQSILAGERTALNFVQHLSGVATLTSRFVEKTRGDKACVLDTRKTLPGLRTLEKYAVSCGGGMSHRRGLYDGVLIKDNHIKIAGSIKAVVEKVRSQVSSDVLVEVETESLDQVKEALEAGVDIIMLDNMSPKDMAQAVKFIAGRAEVEASGGVSLTNVERIARTGVDRISIGALTQAAPPLDISLEIIS